MAIAEEVGQPVDYGRIPNEPDAVRRLVQRLGGPETQLVAAYEAGPTGYALHRQLTSLGVQSTVIAPSLVPVRPGDRVKTDRRDAAKLARLLRSGDLTPVWVPDEEHEALRDLVRARADAKADALRAKHRLSKFLLRAGWSRWGSRRGRASTTPGSTGCASSAPLTRWCSRTTAASCAAAEDRVKRLEMALVHWPDQPARGVADSLAEHPRHRFPQRCDHRR